MEATSCERWTKLKLKCKYDEGFVKIKYFSAIKINNRKIFYLKQYVIFLELITIYKHLVQFSLRISGKPYKAYELCSKELPM